MTHTEPDWISLDYLEIFCEKNQLVIGCHHDDDELWVSPLGPHPSDLTAEEVRKILRHSSVFELRTMIHDEGDPDEVKSSLVLTRSELEQRLKRLSN